MKRVEKALRLGHLSRRELLARGLRESLLGRFGMVHIGAEFCENLLDELRILKDAEHYRGKGLRVCILTPLLTDRGMKRFHSLLRGLESAFGRGKGAWEGVELTVNDFGALRSVREEGLGIRLNVGRLLNKNVLCLRKGIIFVQNRHALGFFAGLGINRFEVSACGDRPETNFPSSGEFGFDPAQVHLTMYYPYLNMTSTRTCLLGMRDPSYRESPGRIDCRRECEACSFEFQHPQIQEELVCAGNTVFMRFPRPFYSSEKELLGIRVDRLVYCPWP